MDTQSVFFVLTIIISWIYVVMAAENATKVSLNIVRKDSSPNHLLITWQLPEGYEMDTLEVRTQKKGSDSMIISSKEHGVTEYKIPDLMTNSEYTVCMYVDLKPVNQSSGLQPFHTDDCAIMSTPPSIRVDSLLILFAVIGYLLLMVLLGYLCWRYAHKKQNEEEEEEEEAEAVEDKIENGESRPFLLNSPPPASERPRPRSAIEDEDIPFITPTWDQLAREKKSTP